MKQGVSDSDSRENLSLCKSKCHAALTWIEVVLRGCEIVEGTLGAIPTSTHFQSWPVECRHIIDVCPKELQVEGVTIHDLGRRCPHKLVVVRILEGNK